MKYSILCHPYIYNPIIGEFCNYLLALRETTMIGLSGSKRISMICLAILPQHQSQ